jgi:hypothetical protein
MPSLGTVTFAGKSGKPYKFKAYPVGTIFKKGFAAVVVLTQRARRETAGAMRHRALYLGQSADLRLGDDEVANALRGTAAANCICVHGEPSAVARAGIQQDLSDTHPPLGDNS